VADHIEKILGIREVDSAVDCVGFEAKGHGGAEQPAIASGQTPVMKYDRALMMAVLRDRIHIAKAVNATVIPLDQAPQGYADFDRLAPRARATSFRSRLSAGSTPSRPSVSTTHPGG
jgi:hypothetical protein